MKRPLSFFGLALAALISSPLSVLAQCTVLNPQYGTAFANTLNLFGDQPPGLTSAKDAWNAACMGTVPELRLGSGPAGAGTGSVNVEIRWGGPNIFPSSHPCSGGCGCSQTTLNAQGQVNDGIVWVFDTADGDTCFHQDTVAAHELGHVLGLDDPSNPSGCSGHLMGPVGRIIDDKMPTAALCAAIDSLWNTDWESPDPCDTPQPPQGCDGESPILIDLDRNGFHLSGLDNPVQFDIDTDGEVEVLSWTAAGTIDAFLCLDRNDNATIDDGSELFGNHTPLIDGSTAANGYIPLAEFDLAAMGGNANGFIDPGDLIFGELDVWIDWNHNGSSETGEVLGLAEAGVSRIDLRYRTSRRRDQHGNEFRYISRAWLMINGQERRTWTTDVFLVLE